MSITTALDLVTNHKDSLVGQTVVTQRMGQYPGGEAVVKSIRPDKNAPEIVFTVIHPSFGEIGVFDNETVELVKT